jgi:hypothetical protein
MWAGGEGEVNFQSVTGCNRLTDCLAGENFLLFEEEGDFILGVFGAV